MRPINNRNLHGYVARLESRTPLGESERRAILNLPYFVEKVPAGHGIALEGRKVDFVWVVASGIVCSFNQAKAKSLSITGLYIRGDMADTPSVALRRASAGLKALSDVKLLRISLDEIDRVRAGYPTLALALHRDLAVDASISNKWLTNNGSRPARTRLAHLFCEMAARYEQTGVAVGLSFELLMTQEQLAGTIAVTPVHLNRVLMGLRKEGIVDVRAKIVYILDWAALTAAAEFDPGYLNFRMVAAY